MPIQRILCPVDFSPCSDHAVHTALRLAKQFKASVELLHVVQMPTYVVPLSPLGAPPVDLWRDLPARLQKQLDQVAARLSDQATVTTALREGSVHASVVSRAQEINADLIVIGTHGHTGFTHVLLGSVAERVVRLAGCPVLTVGLDPKEAPKANERPKILCPVDFSEPSNAALAYATDLATVIGADLHLVHVIPLLAYALRAEEPVDDPQFAAHVREEAMRRLEVLKAERVSKGLQVTVSAIEGAPHEGIARAVDETGASMIVIGTHGHTGFSRVLLGSVAEKVVRTSHVPVLSVRPLAAAESA